MLSLLRSNQPIASAIIPLTGVIFLLLHVLLGANEAGQEPYNAPLLQALQLHLGVYFHFAVIVANGLLLNGLFNRHELVSGRNNLAGWFFVFIVCCIPVALPVGPVLLGGLFFIPGLNATLKVYRQNDGTAHYFNAGFLFGVAALFDGSFALAGLLLFASIFYTRAAKWRELVLPFFGFLLPSAMGIVVLWLFGMPLLDVVYSPSSEHAPFSPQLRDIAPLLVFVLGLLFGFGFLINAFGSSSNKSKNSKAVLVMFAGGLVAASVFVYPGNAMAALTMAAFPAAWVLPWPFVLKVRGFQKVLFMMYVIAGALLYFWTSFKM
jgi:hypothetical protein